MTIGEKIRARRIELGMSQEELGKKLGYKSRVSVNKFEKCRDLPLPKVIAMAEALDVSPEWLCGWDDDSGDKMYIEVTREEYDLLTTFRTVEEAKRGMLKRMLEYAVEGERNVKV